IGGTVSVQITVPEKPDALLVPASAVRNVGSLKYIDVINGDTRQTVSVQTGIVTDTDAEILSGLTEGQQVISGVPPAAPWMRRRAQMPRRRRNPIRHRRLRPRRRRRP